MWYVKIFITVLFVIAKDSKLLKCPLKDGWLNKSWCAYILQCCAAIIMSHE